MIRNKCQETGGSGRTTDGVGDAVLLVSVAVAEGSMVVGWDNVVVADASLEVSGANGKLDLPGMISANPYSCSSRCD